MIPESNAAYKPTELREVGGYPLYERMEPNYTSVSMEWNIQPSLHRKCYPVTIFDSHATSAAGPLKRTRYLYEKDAEDWQSSGVSQGDFPLRQKSMSSVFQMNSGSSSSNPDGAVGSSLAAFFKTPISQIMANQEEKRRERLTRVNAQKIQQNRLAPSRALGNTQTASSAPLKKLSAEYFPEDFTDLVGSDKTNRFALKWLKAWEYKVFGKPYPKWSALTNSPDKPNPYFSGRANTKQQFTNSSANPNNSTNTFANNNRKQFKTFQEEQATYETLSLAKEKDIRELNSKMLLLSGPSGCGKSTLATVIAKKCGYNPYKVELLS